MPARTVAPAPDHAPTVIAEVVATHPHSAEAFTQGLELHDGALFESTGLLRHSSLRVEDLDTGTLREIIALPDEVYGEGLTIFGDRIYQLTLESRRCFVYDLATRERIGEHVYSGEGWGLTHDDTSLWMSDGSALLRVIDPSTFDVRRTLEVHDAGAPVTMLNELEMVRGELWANVWRTTRIARIDPSTGDVRGWIELAPIVESLALTEPEAVLNGIAWDAATDRIYVTGKLWPALYEIHVPE